MSIKDSILSFVRTQSFQPGWPGIVLNPFYLIRRPLYKNIQSLAPHLSGKLMDFGCGRKPYRNLFSVDEYIGVDMQATGHEHTLSLIDVYYDGKHLPFENDTFDSVFCSEVFEHIFNLEEIIPEISRVMKKEAKMLLTVPFCWNEHEVPYDFGRYTSFGLTHLLEKHGFSIIKLNKSGNFIRVIFQLWAVYFTELFRKGPRPVRYALSMFFVIPINLIAVLLSPLFPVNNSLYFNNVVLVKKN